MQNQIRGLVASLLTLALTACVGSINVPEETVDTLIKTIDPESADNPNDALIKRCIMDDNANASSCASIVSEYPCITDPFGAACDITFADYYETAQANRISFCRESYDSSFCASAEDDIEDICLKDPFDGLCFIVSASNYNGTRETICANEKDSPRCATTISRVCLWNPLDVLCVGNETYFSAQKRVCEFNNTDTRCAPTIARVCDVDSLELLCSGLMAYFPAQQTACAGEPNSLRCRPTIVHVCGVNAFDALCQSANLTQRDLPARPNASFITRSTSAPYGGCTRSYNSSRGARSACEVYVPDVINIKPLNNTNTGTATYTGSVVLQHATNNHSPSCTQTSCRYNFRSAFSKNIDIIADFENSTISYSGSFGANPFSINGNFTDRGILTGEVSFNSNEAPLIGLVGQDEMIGVFSRGLRSQNDFAGGFTATRE